MTHSKNYSDDWKNLNWKQFQKVLFRLQKRIFKAIREDDKAKAINLQKLVLSSYAARMLAIRQVTQLNTGKKTALPQILQDGRFEVQPVGLSPQNTQSVPKTRNH